MTIDTLSTNPSAGPTEVLSAIRFASRETGADFGYLLATAQRESGLNSAAKSTGSSASGLFQFIEQTWLSLIKRHGSDHGLGVFAEAIGRTETGRYVVENAETRSAILALRQDPKISALMAGEAAAATKQSLECALGRPVCAGEVYAAHFLGERGARRLIGLAQNNPSERADLAFPAAAKANRTVFYRADGRAKSVAEVHAWAVGHFEPDRQPVTTIAVAAAKEQKPPRAAPAVEFGMPRSPLALSVGVLEILSAFADLPLARRTG